MPIFDTKQCERHGENSGFVIGLLRCQIQQIFGNWFDKSFKGMRGNPHLGLARLPQGIRPATRVWIDNYARLCAFCDVPSSGLSILPKAKLVLFLHQQHEGACVQKHPVRSRLIKFSPLSRMASSIKDKPSLILNVGWWKRQRFIRRSLFHALAGLRYVCEIPRWRWLNRARMRSDSPTA